MRAYIIRRLGQSMILLFLVSLVVFFIIHAAPGGPALLLNPELGKEEALALEEELGLTKPIPVQYLTWLSNLLHGNLGNSFMKGLPVSVLVMERLGPTIYLMFSSLAMAVLVAIPLGVASAVKRYSVIDYAGTLVAFFGLALPSFWYGIILILLFSVILGWLPSGGMYTVGSGFSVMDRLSHLILPSLVLGTTAMAQLTRFTRSSMLSVMTQDYVRTARAKGLAERVVLYRHALRNALVPVITVFGLQLPRLVGGAAITETIFGWPGMGKLAVDAAFQRDYPVIMGVTMVISVVVVAANLLVDLCYALVDPRIRLD